jgi:hypothetical protein
LFCGLSFPLERHARRQNFKKPPCNQLKRLGNKKSKSSSNIH